MATTIEQQKILSLLEDTATLLQKTQTNLKKCPKARLTKGYIEARIKILEDYWKTFKTAHQELLKISPKELRGTLPYFLNEEYYIHEDLYNILYGDLKDMLIALTESSGIEARSQNTSSEIIYTQNSLVHLPKIHIPTFKGDYEEWPTFKDLFTTLVHNNSSLSEVQKLHYLKTSVTSEAESLLKHIRITSDNYVQAWEVLKSRYGNKRLILNSTMKRLFNQRKMTTQSAVQLKNLLDTTSECINSLNNLDVSTASWDPVIIYLLVQKLDPETHRSWEEYAFKAEHEALPTYKQFKMFLELKFRTLELVTSSTKEVKPIKERSYHVATTSSQRRCVMCKDNHTLCHCKEFIKLEPNERSNYVKTNQLCFNCLAPGHSAFKCKLNMSCRICKRRHHSLLHANKLQEPASSSSNTLPPQVSTHVVEEEEQLQVHTMIATHHSSRQKVALLATAIVEATNELGYTIPLRALIDPGSQATFISEKATQLLKLKRRPTRGCVLGVGSTRAKIKYEVQLNIASRSNRSFNLTFQAYVMSKQLTTKIPSKPVANQSWPHLKDLTLADPDFDTPGSIDLLLGVNEYAQIIKERIIKGPPGTPCAQETHLGWIIFGEISEKEQDYTYVVLHHQVDMDEILKTLWEVEHDSKRSLTKEEKLCEKIYESTTTRNKDGRYVVKLPFKTDNLQSPKGNTKEIAIQRFKQLERRFKKAPNLKRDYSNVINNYVIEKHMERIPESEKGKENTVYLPHHAVIRTDKETSRTRIVFDASCKGSNNVSLNDELLVGPQIQEDLRNILMRWRSKRICFVADITKMYLQMMVTKNDADYQRIIWRPNETDDLEEHRLLRVTFGTASAPYLAARTLLQVANDEGCHHNLASKVIKEDFYMDDVLSGSDSTTEAILLAKEIKNILQKGGFQLTKWSSNSVKFMESIDEKERSAKAQLNLNLDGIIKALGVTWNLKNDTFQYNLNLSPISRSITKREILSDLQKLFDPLGWISPSTVMAKILIQKLWLEKIGWDDKINDKLEEEWRQIRSDFTHIKEIEIERWLGTLSTDKEKIQIHGFSDASMHAYAAVVYVRVEKGNGNIETKLLAAKTRVAPLKTISLPRLELCGALLLSKLMSQVGQALRLPQTQMYAWTDSSIVIAWLSGEPNRWKPFVANRVVEIIENINNKHWHHVQSQDNPADLGSRGIMLAELKKCDLWWRGPSWLSEREIKINENEIINTNIERKTIKLNTYLHIDEPVNLQKTLITQLDNFKNLTEALKTIAYCRRFLNFKKYVNKDSKELSTEELEESLNICIKKVQEQEFKEDIEQLKIKKQVKNKSTLKSLYPYLDKKNILRVGGRLRHTQLPMETKNPIILDNKNPLSKLIIANAHEKTLHGGIQLMLCYIRSKFWILKAKLSVKKYIHKCLVCARINASTKTQLMGDLPRERVTPSRAFLHSGVDFAGPFQVLLSKGRGNKTVKTYVAIFVCFSTKAIHLELVGDLTTEAFIGAYRRFVARRGKCSHLWSDQGRNFVGAAKELRDAWNEAKLEFTGEITSTLASDGTQWHFIPAYSPNFGGLWEAGVKSMKYHLKRILTSYLTFEEMTTVLCQIEACLNSRPLSPIDNDIDNLDILTPGHFLIGEAPIVVPHPDMKNTKIHTLSRWQHTQKLLGDFWRRWQGEYLSRLQQRPKWSKTQNEFKIGDVVLIKMDNLPPGKWQLGRITDKYPGADGHTRVYGVKSGNSITKRSVTKLCAFPIDTN